MQRVRLGHPMCGRGSSDPLRRVLRRVSQNAEVCGHALRFRASRYHVSPLCEKMVGTPCTRVWDCGDPTIYTCQIASSWRRHWVEAARGTSCNSLLFARGLLPRGELQSAHEEHSMVRWPTDSGDVRFRPRVPFSVDESCTDPFAQSTFLGFVLCWKRVGGGFDATLSEPASAVEAHDEHAE